MDHDQPEAGKSAALHLIRAEIAAAARRCLARGTDRINGVGHPAAELAAWAEDLRRIERLNAQLARYGGQPDPDVPGGFDEVHEIIAGDLARLGQGF